MFSRRAVLPQDRNNQDVAVAKTVPPNWEHAHNHVISVGFPSHPCSLNQSQLTCRTSQAFRLYYRFDQLDPAFPPAVPLKDIVVPSEKPKDPPTQSYFVQVHGQKAAPAVASKDLVDDEPHIDVAALIGEKSAVEERRKLLAEVREHLDLLKEFEGSISKEDLDLRKRELFMALPPAPPAATPNKKQKGN